MDPDLEHARIPLIRSWRSQERIRLPAGSRRYLSLGHLKVAATGERALHKLGEDVYTFCTRSLLQGACEERRKDRTMFIARMVAVL